MIKKPKILCGALIWVYMLAKKISSHFDIGRVYMLHRGTSRFLCFIGILVSYWSQNYS